MKFSPFLQYGILVWGLTHETYINPVFLLQKRIIRAMSFEHFTLCSYLFLLKGAFREKKLDISELRRLHIKRTFSSLSTFPDISPP